MARHNQYSRLESNESITCYRKDAVFSDIARRTCVKEWKEVYNHPFVRYKVLEGCSHHGLLEDREAYGVLVELYIFIKSFDCFHVVYPESTSLYLYLKLINDEDQETNATVTIIGISRTLEFVF